MEPCPTEAGPVEVAAPAAAAAAAGAAPAGSNEMPTLEVLQQELSQLITSAFPDELDKMTTRGVLKQAERNLGLRPGLLNDRKETERFKWVDSIVNGVLEDIIETNPEWVPPASAAVGQTKAEVGTKRKERAADGAAPGKRQRGGKPAPKQASGAPGFQLFCAERRAEGDQAAGNKTDLGAIWRDLTQEEREQYDLRAKEKAKADRAPEQDAAPAAAAADPQPEAQKQAEGEKDAAQQALPPPPKRPLSSYHFFSQKERSKDASVDSKRLGELWKEVSAEAKQEAEAEAAEDKKRYDEEVKAYIAKHGKLPSREKRQRKGDDGRQKEQKEKKKREPKDPKAPKPAKDAREFYYQDRAQREAAAGELGVPEGGNLTKIKAHMYKRWTELAVDDPVRTEMTKKAAADAERHARELAEYGSGAPAAAAGGSGSPTAGGDEDAGEGEDADGEDDAEGDGEEDGAAADQGA
eukprot:TRINITY_DN1344_c0_g1_i1.p1 TRINITY_DN1344_c0_g1~~TRINITY_DN1344_c0_g1_i1.p1  ORF type:complete len:496 (+),score=223.84 TRINITY_DN1344_c0_g1_i1:93-1490(+)